MGWLSFLSWQNIRLRKTYEIFFSNTDKANLKNQLRQYAQDVSEAHDKLDELATFVANLHKSNLNAYSQIGLVRFNPFNDTGGDQSFCLALLDHHNSGIVISSIHARTGTRFYAKRIIAGKPSHPLSEEEQAAYASATGTKKKR